MDYLLRKMVNVILIIMKDELGALRHNVSTLIDTVRILNASIENGKVANVAFCDSIMNEKENSSIDTESCGGTGGWRRIAYLNMTEPNTACPPGWQIPSFSNQMCGRVNTSALSCDSVTFPVSGGEYSKVCGRVSAYSYGGSDAFYAYHNGNVSTIDEAYVAGVSVTHGSSPRQHIWTFAAGLTEGDPMWPVNCPCDANITIQVPSFVGEDNYFCESAVNKPWYSADYHREMFHSNDPLWDGQNCLQNSTCCALNGPPYFVKTLSAPTTDNIEARICLYDTIRWDNLAVQFLELYVQ